MNIRFGTGPRLKGKPCRDAASRRPPQADNPALNAELRARIAAIEGAGPGPGSEGQERVRPLVVPEIDAALSWGGLRGAALRKLIGIWRRVLDDTKWISEAPRNNEAGMALADKPRLPVVWLGWIG